MKKSLQEKTAIATGGGEIMGSAASIVLANAGAKVMVVDFVREKTQEFV